MSTKYSADTSRHVDDGIVLTDHAIFRYRQRTPEDCSVSPQLAWRRGEDIKHPQVAQSDGEDVAPERVRVYRHGEEWSICFLVGPDLSAGSQYGAEYVVLTCNHIQGFDHGPTRAYLHSHGPHAGSGVKR